MFSRATSRLGTDPHSNLYYSVYNTCILWCWFDLVATALHIPPSLLYFEPYCYGDRWPFVGIPSWYVTSHPGNSNSVSYPQWDGKWVAADEHWHCSLVGKVPVHLMLQWPCHIFSRIFTYGLNVLKGRCASYLQSSLWYGILYSITFSV